MVVWNRFGAKKNEPWAVIPTCGESEWIYQLVHKLRDAGVNTCVVTNNMDPEAEEELMFELTSEGGCVYPWPSEDANIYEIWNWAMLGGRWELCSSVALLNDDIEIDGRSVHKIDRLLRDHSRLGALGWDYLPGDIQGDPVMYVNGSYRKGGVGGFAFSVVPEFAPMIDTGYTWWGGDDDLFNKIVSEGHRLGIARNVKVKHHTSTSQLARPEVTANIDRDRARLLSRWGETW